LPLEGGSIVAIADLGLDRIIHYRIDRESSLIDATPIEETILPPGYGPRHLVTDAAGSTIYVVNELASSVAVLVKEKHTGRWAVLQTVSTLPDGWTGENLCAAIQLSPDGRHLYCSNRGHDSLVWFQVSDVDGSLADGDWISSSGRTPRSFCFDKRGRVCVVTNQNSGRVNVFTREAATGALERTTSSIEVGTPMCVLHLNY
jgi:6-phosphogluconolactonase